MEIEKYYNETQLTNLLKRIKKAQSDAVAATPAIPEPTVGNCRAFIAEITATDNIDRVLSDAGGIGQLAEKYKLTKVYAKGLVEELKLLLNQTNA